MPLPLIAGIPAGWVLLAAAAQLAISSGQNWSGHLRAGFSNVISAEVEGGQVRAAATIQYVALDGPGGTPAVRTKDVVAALPLNTTIEYAMAHPELFPEIFGKGSYDRQLTDPGTVVRCDYVSLGKTDRIYKITGPGVAYQETINGNPQYFTERYSFDGSEPPHAVWNNEFKTSNLINPTALCTSLTGSPTCILKPYYVDTITSGSTKTARFLATYYPAVPTSEALSPTPRTPLDPFSASAALKASSGAISEVSKAMTSISGPVLYDTTNPATLTAPQWLPEVAQPEQIVGANRKEFQAELDSLKQSAAAAQTVAQNNPTTENLNISRQWSSAALSLEQAGVSGIAPGYPITSGAGTFPTYDGSVSSPPTVAAPTITPGAGTASPADTFGSSVYAPSGVESIPSRTWSSSSTAYRLLGQTASISGSLSDFWSQLKQTSIFSLASTFGSSIPTSSESRVTINGGSSFGVHTLDFASWSPVFGALSGVLLLVSTWVSVKIITKGGGSA